MEHCRMLFVALFSALVSLQFNLFPAQTHVTNFCIGENYTANSVFQANLNLLLSSISNNTAPENIRFNSDSVGRNPDNVYGLFQCRGDYSLEDCRRCAGTAAKEITDLCPYKRESIVYYDECLLHYSNMPFVSTVLYNPNFVMQDFDNASDPDLFSAKRAELMERLVFQAVYNSTNMFASGEDRVTSSEKIYGLVQCTQDLSRNDCNRCLRMSVSEFPICCHSRKGGRSLKPSCNARYESYEFFQTNTSVVTPSPAPPGGNRSFIKVVVIAVASVTAAILLFIIILYFFCLRRKKDVDQTVTADSLLFDFATVVAATEHFSDANWIGEGGFGAVYKGKLSDGQEIAVRRLSRISSKGQRIREFKTEVLLLAKLRHRNLVRLTGFCIKADEKLLIYEFVPNASLDQLIFDSSKRAHLDWERRYKIIGGIARGLLYLHEDSRDTVIHRDLKANNVLLDTQMNPKIADFGLAKLFVAAQTHGDTSGVAGKYGYMAPEYARHGHFSTKTDVFSFGVLVLEIISGQKNNKSYESEFSEDLLSQAWRQWENGTALELLDPTLGDHYSRSEVIRCIHIGLLCVQEDAARRPTMASVLLMLNSYSGTIPLPAFSNHSTNGTDMISGERDMNTKTSSRSVVQGATNNSSIPVSVNETTITELYPR